MEKWALSEVKQESESGEKVLWPWKVVQNSGAEEAVKSGRAARSWEPLPSSEVCQLPWRSCSSSRFYAHTFLAGRYFHHMLDNHQVPILAGKMSGEKEAE